MKERTGPWVSEMRVLIFQGMAIIIVWRTYRGLYNKVVNHEAGSMILSMRATTLRSIELPIEGIRRSVRFAGIEMMYHP